MKTAPSRRAQVCAWTCKTPLNRLGATSRCHDLNPAEAYGALAGKRSEPHRLGVRAHTHALCALKVQPKLSNGVAGFTAGGSSLEIAAIPAISEMTNIRQECPGTKSELHLRNAAAQTRIVSGARNSAGALEICAIFKGIICDDISEFESYMSRRR